MAEQLRLIDPLPPAWKLTPKEVRVGLIGVQATRKAIQEAKKNG